MTTCHASITFKAISNGMVSDFKCHHGKTKSMACNCFSCQMAILLVKRRRVQHWTGSLAKPNSSKKLQREGQRGNPEVQRAKPFAPEWQSTGVVESTGGLAIAVRYCKKIPMHTSHECSSRKSFQYSRRYYFLATQCTSAWCYLT